MNIMAIHNKVITHSRNEPIYHSIKRDSLVDLIYGIFRILGIIIQNIYCVSSYLVLSWIVLFPISWFRCDLYSKAENYLYNSLLFIVSSWSLAAGATIIETGDEYKYLIEESDKTLDKSHDTQANGSSRGIKSFQWPHKRKATEPLPGSEAGCDNKPDKNKSQNSGVEISASDLKQKPDTTSCNFQVQRNNNIILNEMSQTTQDCRDVSSVEKSSLKSSLKQRQPRILLLCNHISTADVPLIMQSFSTMTKHSLLWVLDAQFKLTNFGLVCSSHGDFFIAKNCFTDGSLRDQVLKYPDRNLLVLFPEGGFWRKRLEGSNRYARKNGLPSTEYVTHPRFGAFKDLMDPSVGVTHIVDTTLFYHNIREPLSILDIALGSRKEPAIMYHKIYNRDDINPTEEWLRSIWLDKDKLLQKFYSNRESVHKTFKDSVRSAKLDWFKLLSVHLFYLLVCYLTIYRLFNATSVTMLRARDLYYSNI